MIASTFFTIEVVGVEMRRCVMVEKKRLQGFGVFVAPLGKVSQSYPFSKVVKQHTVQCYAWRCPTPISCRGAARLFAGTLREFGRYHPCSTFRQAAARVTSLVVSR